MVKVMRRDGKVHDNYPQSFTLEDLESFAAFLRQADEVIPMRESAEGKTDARYIAMRHDVDHDPFHALRFAQWEHAQGFRSTYFILHTAWYWSDRPALVGVIRKMEKLGHEVGIHHDAIGQAIRESHKEEADRRFHAARILTEALVQLRSTGADVVGSCMHGSSECYDLGIFNNDIWQAYEVEEFDLKYEAYDLHKKKRYVSDNRGTWRIGSDFVVPSDSLAEYSPDGPQYQFCVHPCHWTLP